MQNKEFGRFRKTLESTSVYVGLCGGLGVEAVLEAVSGRPVGGWKLLGIKGEWTRVLECGEGDL